MLVITVINITVTALLVVSMVIMDHWLKL